MGRDARINREQKGAPTQGHYILDRHGRTVTAGCELVLTQPVVQSLLVQSITPAVQVDPRAQPLPPGMVKVECLAHMTFLAAKGVPQREFILARSVQELIDAGMLREVPEGAEVTGAEVAVPQAEGQEQQEELPLDPPNPGPKLVALTDAPDPRD